jgi:hypothetical protein
MPGSVTVFGEGLDSLMNTNGRAPFTDVLFTRQPLDLISRGAKACVTAKGAQKFKSNNFLPSSIEVSKAGRIMLPPLLFTKTSSLPPVAFVTFSTASEIDVESSTSRVRTVALGELMRDLGAFDGVRTVAKT